MASKGTWIELDESGRAVGIVHTRPARSVRLVDEGQEITPAVKARIEAAEASLSGVTRGGPAPQAVTGEAKRTTK